MSDSECAINGLLCVVCVEGPSSIVRCRRCTHGVLSVAFVNARTCVSYVYLRVSDRYTPACMHATMPIRIDVNTCPSINARTHTHTHTHTHAQYWFFWVVDSKEKCHITFIHTYMCISVLVHVCTTAYVHASCEKFRETSAFVPAQTHKSTHIHANKYQRPREDVRILGAVLVQKRIEYDKYFVCVLVYT